MDAVEYLLSEFIDTIPNGRALLAEAEESLILAGVLHDLRTAAGLTQAQLAKRAGTSRTVITRIEEPGYDRHTLTTLRRIAAALGHGVRVELYPLPAASKPATKRRKAATKATPRTAKPPRK